MIKFLPQSNLRPDHWHSMLISLLRGLAALQVVAAHLRAGVFPGYAQVPNPTLAFKGLAFATGFAHLAVVVFFVLSGWLVGGSLLNKMSDERAISNYAIDRVTRLWIVLAPVLAVSLLLGVATGTLDAGRPDLGSTGEFALGTYVGNLLGLQNILVEPFGGNFPLWSLSNETWYYVMFPLVILMLRAGSTFVTRALSLVGLLAISMLVSVDLLVYFAVWLLGTVFSRVRIDASAAARWILFAVFIGSGVYFRLRGYLDDLTVASFKQDLLFALAFVLWLSSMQFEPKRFTPVFRPLNRIGQFFANFSFTLYVLHVPFILALSGLLGQVASSGKLAPDNFGHYLVYLAMYGGVVLAAYLLYLPFEANTQRLRRRIKALFAFGAARARA